MNIKTIAEDTLKSNPKKIRARFSRMKHAISEKLYFVYYLRNGVLSSERSPKIQGFQSAECLEDFPLSKHQNIRKAVLCVLPKEFCVRRSEKDPMIQGLPQKKSEEDSSVFCEVEPRKQVQAVLCVLPNALLVTSQKTPKILRINICRSRQRYISP